MNKNNRKKTVIAYAHTHWDREWYREFEEFRTRLVEVVDDVLEKLEKKEIPSFYFDGQTAALEDYLEIKPEKKSDIEKFIKEKKLFIGPYYCSTDSFLVDSELLIKNLQIGIDYAKSFGCNDFIAYHADTFGHSADIAHIIKHFNINNALFWRGLGELDSEFLFNGVKSTYLIEGYFHDYFCSTAPIENKIKSLKRTLDRISQYSSSVILLPLGADHMGVADNIKEQIEQANSLLDDYEIVLSTPFDYLKKVKNNYKKNICHEFRDTKRNFILPGVLSSRIDIKQQNAKLQWRLSRVTQPMQAICSYLGLSKNFQNETNHAYKVLLQNHPHDSIYGCSTDLVHKENLQRYITLKQITNSIENSVRRDIEEYNNLSVLNLSNYTFNGALEIKTDKKLPKELNAQLISKEKGFPLQKLYNIKQVPVTEDYTTIYNYLVDLVNIKPFSIKNISINDIKTNSTLKITKTSIENDKISLSVKNGKIQIVDKISGNIYSDFIKIKDRADIGDSYNFGALKKDKPIYAKIIKTEIKQKGSIRSKLNIYFECKIPKNSTEKGRSAQILKNNFLLTAKLDNQNDFIEFETKWINRSNNHILQIEFLLKDNIKETLSDDLIGYTKRQFDYDYDIYKHIPATRGIELKHNTAPLQKCVWTQGIGLITEGLQEYEINKNKLNLTILRATGTISNPHNPTRGTPAGPPLPTPDLQMKKCNESRFAICFKSKIQDLSPIIEKFYQTTQMFNANLNNTQILDWKNKNVLINTIKTDSNGNLLIRFVNKSNKKQTFSINTDLDYSKIVLANEFEKETNTTITTNKTIAIESKYFLNISIQR